MPHPRALVRTSFATMAVALCAVGLAVAAPASAAPDAAAATATVRGVVTGGGRPLQGVQVWAGQSYGVFGGRAFGIDVRTTTAADGSYRLTGVPTNPGERIQFYAPGAVGGTSPSGYADLCVGGQSNCATSGREFTFRAGSTTTGIDGALPRAGVLRGRLVDVLGRGVGGVQVQLFEGSINQSDDGLPQYTVTSDADGNWLIPRLAAHSWGLCAGLDAKSSGGTPNRDGYVGACRTSEVTTASGRTTTADFQLRGGGGVTGRVVDSAGRPVAGAQVALEQTDILSPPLSVTTDATGLFRVGQLAPGGQTITVMASPAYFQRNVDIVVTSFATTAAGRIVLTRAS